MSLLYWLLTAWVCFIGLGALLPRREILVLAAAAASLPSYDCGFKSGENGETAPPPLHLRLRLWRNFHFSEAPTRWLLPVIWIYDRFGSYVRIGWWQLWKSFVEILPSTYECAVNGNCWEELQQDHLHKVIVKSIIIPNLFLNKYSKCIRGLSCNVYERHPHTCPLNLTLYANKLN